MFTYRGLGNLRSIMERECVPMYSYILYSTVIQMIATWSKGTIRFLKLCVLYAS